MFEIRALNPDAIAADLAYRREQLMGNRIANPLRGAAGGGVATR